MSTSFMSYGGVLVLLPILICQWVGILGLAKTSRNPAWWCMMIGVCSTTLGNLFYGVYIGLMLTRFSSFGIRPDYYFFIPMILNGLGSMLFAIGFAIHGQQASRSHQRITELETIANAQGEELSRLRSS